MNRNICILISLIVFILTSCISNTLRKQQTSRKPYYPVQGSVIRVLDSGKIKYLFLECRTKYYMDYRDSNNLIENYNRKFASYYDFKKIYQANTFDSLMKYYECKLVYSIAPDEVKKNILKDSIIIYSTDYSTMSSNCLWYCINGYFPFDCCYEGPVIYVNKRVELNMNTYRFTKDW